MSVAPPKSFFSTYAQLISLSEDASADSFYSTEDYSRLESLGPSLPKIPYPLPQSQAATNAADEVIVVNVKSIKPPFKFSVLMSGIPLSQSVFKVKSQLVQEVPILKDAGASPANLKLMIKAKVLSDSTLLSAVAAGQEEISILAMVSAPEKPVESATTTESKPEISDNTWTLIQELLEKDLGEELAQSTLKRFKASAE